MILISEYPTHFRICISVIPIVLNAPFGRREPCRRRGDPERTSDGAFDIVYNKTISRCMFYTFLHLNRRKIYKFLGFQNLLYYKKN